MDPHLSALVDLGRSSKPEAPAGDLVAGLLRIPAVRDFLLSLPPGETDPFGRLRTHFSDRADIVELLDSHIELTRLRMAAAKHATAEINHIAGRN